MKTGGGRKLTGVGRLAALAGVVVAALLTIRYTPLSYSHFTPSSIKAFIQGLGVWGPAIFVLGYVIAVVAFVPASLLTLGAGAIFGIVHGVIYVFVAAKVG